MNVLLANKGVSIFIVLSVCFILLVSRYAPSPEQTYDSRAYIEASQSIDTYFNGKNADGYTYLYRPPLFPTYLHFFEDKILAAKCLNAVCFVLSLWLCFLIGREFKFEPIFLSSFIICVGASYPWLQNHFFVWSEPLFGTLLLLLAWFMIRGISWPLIVILCALLYFTRKVGLFISIAVIVECVFRGERHRAVQISLVLGTIFTLWESISFFFSGENIPQQIFLQLANASRWYWLDAVTAWFMPRNVELPIRTIVMVAFISLMFHFFKRQLNELALTGGLAMVMRLALIYLLFFVVLLGVAEFGEADRYLSMLIPLVMLLVVAFVRLAYLQTKHGKYFLAGFVLWMVYPIGRTLYHLL